MNAVRRPKGYIISSITSVTRAVKLTEETSSLCERNNGGARYKVLDGEEDERDSEQGEDSNERHRRSESGDEHDESEDGPSGEVETDSELVIVRVAVGVFNSRPGGDDESVTINEAFVNFDSSVVNTDDLGIKRRGMKSSTKVGRM